MQFFDGKASTGPGLSFRGKSGKQEDKTTLLRRARAEKAKRARIRLEHDSVVVLQRALIRRHALGNMRREFQQKLNFNLISRVDSMDIDKSSTAASQSPGSDAGLVKSFWENVALWRYITSDFQKSRVAFDNTWSDGSLLSQFFQMCNEFQCALESPLLFFPKDYSLPYRTDTLGYCVAMSLQYLRYECASNQALALKDLGSQPWKFLRSFSRAIIDIEVLDKSLELAVNLDMFSGIQAIVLFSSNASQPRTETLSLLFEILIALVSKSQLQIFFASFSEYVLSIPNLPKLLSQEVLAQLRKKTILERLLSSINIKIDMNQLASKDAACLLSNLIAITHTVFVENPDRPGVHDVSLPSLVSIFSRLLQRLPESRYEMPESEYEDSDIEDFDPWTHSTESKTASQSHAQVVYDSFRILFEESSILSLFNAALQPHDDQPHNFISPADICNFYWLLSRDRKALEFKLLNVLAFRATNLPNLNLLQSLWYACANPETQSSSLGDERMMIFSIDQLLSETSRASGSILDDRLPILDIFCKAYSHFLLVQDENEMFKKEKPFNIEEIRGICSSLRDLVFWGLWENPSSSQNLEVFQLFSNRKDLLHSVSSLLYKLHTCNERHKFLENNFWIAGNGILNSDLFISNAINMPIDSPVKSFSQVKDKGSSISLSCKNVLTIFPYMVPFEARAKIFSEWIKKDRNNINGNYFFSPSSQRHWVRIRRDHIFEDALSSMNHIEGGMRKIVQIKFIDEFGNEEAGIDGGGLFKEFMHEFTAQAFSPSMYGLFKSTEDGRLYPNPSSHLITADHLDQFKFLGKMLGKALFDGVLVDIPLASFFINKLLLRSNTVQDLKSLDPDLHKNLMYLKHCPADEVGDLGITFTVSENDFGEMREVDLVKNGSTIDVDGANRMLYIYKMADYRLNKQIQSQCNAFISGFFELIPPQMIKIFRVDEIQKLISGDEGKVDLADMRRHCQYSGGYSEDHQVIKWFWKALAEFSPEDQQRLLRFVTSSPRAPLLGFRFLNPQFCIQKVNTEEGDARLPTASTCMNLLKLPEYSNYELVRDKLKYALQSHTGFGLS